jgi:hypothetical protein
MKFILSRVVNKRKVTLYQLDSGGYRIKSGNFTQTFKVSCFDFVYDVFKGFN